MIKIKLYLVCKTAKDVLDTLDRIREIYKNGEELRGEEDNLGNCYAALVEEDKVNPELN